MVLTTDDKVVSRTALDCRIRIVKYWLNPIKKGMVLHVGHWMQFVPARVEEVDEGADWRNPMLKLQLQKELVLVPGSRAVLTSLEGGKLRVIGTAELG
jgi:hypothetical protein